MNSISTELRQAVLQAAMQGKLTKQLSEDGNARDLLKQIKIEKEMLIKEKKIKTEKELAPITEDEIPFDIPDNWEWCRLGNVCVDIFSGKSPFYVKEVTNFRIIGQAANQQYGLNLSEIKFTDFKFWSSMDQRFFLRKNDVILNTLGNGTLGRSGIIQFLPYPLLTDGHLFVFRTLDFYSSKYLYYYFQLKRKEIEKKANGTTNQTFLSLINTKKWIIPLPPLAEQKRIVARVDELMVKIDELEVIENNLRELHQAFPNDMKASLLQSAMQGKLTEQLPEDGDSKLLLEEALNSRKSIGKLPKTNVIDDVGLPDNWSYASVGNIFGLLKGNNISGKKLPYLEAKYLRGNIEAVIKDKGEFVVKGTRVILVDGENSGEIFIEPEDGYLGSTFKVLYIPECLNKKFACYFLDMNKILLRKKKKGAAIPHLNKEIFYNLVFPVPPLAEQKRIVEKLDRLLPLCDSLQTEL